MTINYLLEKIKILSKDISNTPDKNINPNLQPKAQTSSNLSIINSEKRPNRPQEST